MNATDQQQTPWESSSLTGDFYFVRSPTIGESTGSSEPAMTQEQAVDVAFWKALPPKPARADYEAYLQRYPEGVFAALAQSRLEGWQYTESASAMDSACSSVVGRWLVKVNNVDIDGAVLASEDGTLEWWKHPDDKLPSVTGRWICDSPQGRRLIFTWGHGRVDTLTLSADSQSLTGRV